MTPEQHQRATDLFLDVCELPPEERASFLQQSCSDDPEVLAEVHSLLTEDATSEGFLDRPALGSAIGLDIPELAAEEGDDPLIGMRIGRCTVQRRIAVGGMGAVYLAQQETPRRTVALKVMKQGMASTGLMRRFEHEVQLLGRLQHAGIAQIFEAGAFHMNNAHLPYFAMEYVEGLPLMEFVESHELTTRQRIELLIRICDAVHHAHQKGVIHRDLKPSNILVTEPSGATTLMSATSYESADGVVGRPKILDFGVARATDCDIQSTTIQTNVGQLIGTLSYMSPEQAAGNPEDIDIRSDVYALGVLLNELLTDHLPYDLRGKALHEAVRVIREVEPTPISRVNRTLRGDLETITLKALEKERGRRYQSAAELAADLRRYLADEPISARPPSTVYQFRKFARRNRALVTGVAVAFLVLIVGAAATTVAAIIAIQQRDQATEALTRVQQQSDALYDAFAFESAEFTPEEIRRMRAPDIIDRMAERLESKDYRPEVEGDLRQFIGRTYRTMGLYDVAESQLARSRDLLGSAYGPDDHRVMVSDHELATVYRETGRLDEAQATLDRVLAAKRAIGLEERAPDDVLVTRHELALVLQQQGRFDEALPATAAVLADRERLAERLESSGDPADADRLAELELAILNTQNNLALIHKARGEYDTAIELATTVVERRTELLGADRIPTLQSMHNLGAIHLDADHAEDAVVWLNRALDGRRRSLPSDDPDLVSTLRLLARAHVKARQLEMAMPYYDEALRIEIQRDPPRWDEVVELHKHLGLLYKDLDGGMDRAFEHLATALELLETHRPEDLVERMETRGTYARLLRDAHRYGEARNAFATVIAEARQRYGEDEQWKLGAYLALMASCCEQLREYDAAIAALREAEGLLEAAGKTGLLRQVRGLLERVEAAAGSSS